MAQWGEMLRLDLVQGRLSQLYERKFPRHIRHCLSFCIESHDWDSAAVDENKAAACFHALLLYLEQQWNRSVQDSNVLPGPDYPGMKDYLVRHFQDEPQNLARILSGCLQDEKQILASASQYQGRGSPAVEHQWRDLDNGVDELKRQIMEVKKEIRSLEVLYENHDYIEKTWQSKVEQYVGLAQSQAAVREECLRQANFIMRTKEMVLVEILNILKQAEQIVAVLTDVELPEWKRRQQKACVGGPVDTSLDHLQKWFTTVAEVLLQVRQLLQKLQEQSKKYNSADASGLPGEPETFALSLLTKLLANALVVEKQPVMPSIPQRPLILKTSVRFTAAVRFLANLPEFKCLLKVKPVFDKDVEEALIMNGLRQFAFYRDDSKVLDVDSPAGGLVAEFAHMSIKESKMKAKGSCENRLGVTEELHIIKFVTVLQYAGLRCNIEASSLPVVVVSSTNQIPSAWAALMWCSMLSSSEPRNLLLFADPPPLSWQQLSQVLSWQFLSVGQRGLNENQLSMLRDKIVDDPNGLIHWSQFKSESAWIWIEGILDLIKRHLVDLWRDGCIMGFVSRKTTQVLLREKVTGTFLLRFSESNKEGAITFSWVEHLNGEPDRSGGAVRLRQCCSITDDVLTLCMSYTCTLGPALTHSCKEAHVHAVDPYTKKDLLALSLPDIIYLYSLRAQGNVTRNPLLYLYPDIHRDAAFGRYCNTVNSAPKTDVSGYIDRKLVPFSVYHTPPSSPHLHMEVDPDASVEDHQLIQELYDDLLDLPGSPLSLSSYANFSDHYSPS
ncbi:signal transducer and activator of transcription 1-alpha/beta isoform X1 [Scophthalmus maximus]|uniref:signal transducer and activator of transcription 1-alpha/beta isoform X1 n=1 Tax=Scophthalmus maximus TaxID=52904 RepID=UPI0015E0EA2E|nr:signal transducer and activator of transcription 1-alpha/beta isoform X1 [Scophthalmus maximus]